jgi:hypothetical protein
MRRVGHVAHSGKRCIQSFGGENLIERGRFGTKRNGRIILKLTFKKKDRGSGLE